jgi:flagellar protein FliS
MSASARETYLMTQALTAPPQKLQLMLIDGAIRFAGQVLSHWQAGENQAAAESLARCRQIVSEIVAGIRPDGNDLARKVRSVYGYLFRTLTEAQLERSAAKIADCLRILRIEQETWQQLCRQLGNESPSGAPSGSSARSQTAAYALPRYEPGETPTGISLEA